MASRQVQCQCDCPYCGVSSKETEDEKSTIIGQEEMETSLDKEQSPQQSGSEETDRAVKLKLSQTNAAVRCPKCQTRLRVQLGASVVADDDDSMDETDSLYEVKDAYEKWTRQ